MKKEEREKRFGFLEITHLFNEDATRCNANRKACKLRDSDQKKKKKRI